MMQPFDTALLKHQPDHLRPATQAEHAAARVPHPKAMSFWQFVAQVFAPAPRHGRAVQNTAPDRALAETRF